MEEKEKYIEKIMEMLKKIKSTKILHCIYVFVSDIMKEEQTENAEPSVYASLSLVKECATYAQRRTPLSVTQMYVKSWLISLFALSERK